MKKKTESKVKLHTFLVCAYKSPDFAQSQKIFAQSHDCQTVTFRNSVTKLFVEQPRLNQVC